METKNLLEFYTSRKKVIDIHKIDIKNYFNIKNTPFLITYDENIIMVFEEITGDSSNYYKLKETIIIEEKEDNLKYLLLLSIEDLNNKYSKFFKHIPSQVFDSRKYLIKFNEKFIDDNDFDSNNELNMVKEQFNNDLKHTLNLIDKLFNNTDMILINLNSSSSLLDNEYNNAQLIRFDNAEKFLNIFKNIEELVIKIDYNNNNIEFTKINDDINTQYIITPINHKTDRKLLENLIKNIKNYQRNIDIKTDDIGDLLNFLYINTDD